MSFALYFIAIALAGPVLIVGVLLLIRLIWKLKKWSMEHSGLPSFVARMTSRALVLLPIALFCGLMVATAGGAMYPPLVERAAVYVCDGKVERQSSNYSYKPGQSGVSHVINCTAPDGSRRNITLRAVGAATVYYSLYAFVGLFVLVTLGIMRFARWAPRSSADTDALISALRDGMAKRLHTASEAARRRPERANEAATEQTAAERLRDLQSLRDGGLISETEYQAKRAEILTSL